MEVGLTVPFLAFGFLGLMLTAEGHDQKKAHKCIGGVAMIFAYPISHIWLPELIKMF